MPRFIPTSTDDPAAVRLLDAYFRSRELGFTTHPGGYLIRQPDPTDFEPPTGIFLLVAHEGGQPVGCGGLRRIEDVDGRSTYEVKHVWIGEDARGRGWSRLLMAELEQRARAMGAEQLVLDTNESLAAAQHLYRSSGYVEIPAYNDNRNATHWFKKDLGA